MILESGANYCVESMNAIDYAKDENAALKIVMAVHYAGDYGDDAAAGAKIAAEKLGLTFTDVKTDPGADKQAGAIAQIVAAKPDLVILTTAPDRGRRHRRRRGAAQGFTGRFIGTSPTWNPAPEREPGRAGAGGAVPAVRAVAAVGRRHPRPQGHAGGPRHARSPLSDGYTAGWVWSYPLKAALEKAAAEQGPHPGRPARRGEVADLGRLRGHAARPGAGNYAAGADRAQVRVTAISKPDKTAPTGVTTVQPLTAGPTAQAFTLSAACYTSK